MFLNEGTILARQVLDVCTDTRAPTDSVQANMPTSRAPARSKVLCKQPKKIYLQSDSVFFFVFIWTFFSDTHF